MILYGIDIYIMNQQTERLNKIGTYKVHVSWTYDDPREKRNTGLIRRKGEMREVVRIGTKIGEWFLVPKRDDSQTPEPKPELAMRKG